MRFVFLLLLTGCVDALSQQDVTRLKDAQVADLRIYQSESVDPVSRAYSRAAFCLVEAALRSANASTYDSKGSIVCVKEKQ